MPRAPSPCTMNGLRLSNDARPGIVDPPALGRIGIGIGEMREIGRQRRLAMHGDGVRRRGRGDRLRKRARAETAAKHAEINRRMRFSVAGRAIRASSITITSWNGRNCGTKAAAKPIIEAGFAAAAQCNTPAEVMLLPYFGNT